MDFSYIFNLSHIDEAIRSEVQQVVRRIVQKIYFYVNIGGLDKKHLERPWVRLGGISFVKALSINVFRKVLSKFDSPCEMMCNRKIVGDVMKLFQKQEVLSTVMEVLDLVKELNSEISLTHLSVFFILNKPHYTCTDYEDNSLSTLKTLADPFKVLRGIKRSELKFRPWLQMCDEGKDSSLDEMYEEFYQYRTSWKNALAHPKDSSSFDRLKTKYHQFLQNLDDISTAMKPLDSLVGSYKTSSRCKRCNLTNHDYEQEVLSDLLEIVREARDRDYDTAQQQLNEITAGNSSRR